LNEGIKKSWVGRLFSQKKKEVKIMKNSKIQSLVDESHLRQWELGGVA